MRLRRDIFSGAVLEIEFFSVSDRVRNIEQAEPPKPRFETEDEREGHRAGISRRYFTRMVNENYSPSSIYSTHTYDDEYEAHTFEEVWNDFENYKRALRRMNPDVKIIAVAGRGKSTGRIHLHMLIDGAGVEEIRAKWKKGRVVHAANLRAHNHYDGIDHGKDYTALAQYLHNHWTPEQGKQRWRKTVNVKPPERVTVEKNEKRYSVKRPPKLPKGYKLVEAKASGFGGLYFKAVKIPDAKKPPKRE
ncbi:MAG: hypothetical protein FWF86_09355 [Clostridia bacterium]|nr:hypothetical protein [Clostridia bacterium]